MAIDGESSAIVISVVWIKDSKLEGESTQSLATVMIEVSID
jgi:hypothetical protein